MFVVVPSFEDGPINFEASDRRKVGLQAEIEDPRNASGDASLDVRSCMQAILAGRNDG